MKSIIGSLQEGRFPILVSLPRNEMELAQAALDGGADGIKVHLNAHHRASGTRFGTFQQEKPFLSAFSKLRVPKAIMIGQESLPTREELIELSQMGFEAFNLYLKHAKPYLFDVPMAPILALEHGFGAADLSKFREIPKNGAVEASIINPADYGKPLELEDLQAYSRIVRETGLPVIVPSQKKIEPDDLKLLKERGVHSLLVGVIVTGTTPESIRESVRKFIVARQEMLR